jgi:CRP-like cAMP-binding protein
MAEVSSFLKRLDVFNGLADVDLAKVAHLCAPVEFRAGDLIVAIGEPTGHFYLVSEGTIEITTQPGVQPSGEGVRLTLGRGQMFGEMGLVDRGSRSATARALSDVALYVVDYDAFLALCEQLPILGYRVMRNIAADLSFKLRQRNLM